MGKLIREVKNSSYSRGAAADCDLSILLGVDRLSYLVSDERDNALLLKDYRLSESAITDAELKPALQEVLLADADLKLAYRRTKIALISQYATLIPDRFYQPDKQTTYLASAVPDTAMGTLADDLLRQLGVRNVYTYAPFLSDMLGRYFRKPEIVHSYTPLLLSLRQAFEHQQGKRLYVNVREHIVQIVFMDGDELILCNSYPYQSAEDFIYYVLLVMEQFRLKPESVPVTLSGLLVLESEVYRLLYRYIRHLRFMPTPGYYQYSAEFKTLPEHYYFDLYSLKLV